MDDKYIYHLRNSLITPTEKSYLTAIKKSLPKGYFVQPQINLASIIDRTDDTRFHNELFRNIDACVFNMEYKPIVLIEINDPSHEKSDRKARDIKVKNICEEAGIQLITFWTKYGVNENYISQKVNEAITAAPNIKPKPHIENGQQKKEEDGCYIATSVYGSYDCPQVWVLRRFRDFKLYKNPFGRVFIHFYYKISPYLVEKIGNTELFERFWRKYLDKLVNNLINKGFSDEPYKDRSYRINSQRT